MLKKNLIILFIVFCIICISNVCFANNMGNSIKNGVSSVTNTVVDGTQNLARDVRNGVGNVENGIEGALTMDNNTTNARTMATTDDYTATRTATTTDATGNTGLFGLDSSTMWVWLIVAIAAIGIIGLVWYYGSQNRVD